MSLPMKVNIVLSCWLRKECPAVGYVSMSGSTPAASHAPRRRSPAPRSVRSFAPKLPTTGHDTRPRPRAGRAGQVGRDLTGRGGDGHVGHGRLLARPAFLCTDPVDEVVGVALRVLGVIGLDPAEDLLVGEAVRPESIPRLVLEQTLRLDVLDPRGRYRHACVPRALGYDVIGRGIAPAFPFLLAVRFVSSCAHRPRALVES